MKVQYKKLTTLLLTSLFLLRTPLAQANSVVQQITNIEEMKKNKIDNGDSLFDSMGKENVPMEKPHSYVRLSDGSEADLSNYAVVVFMQAHCPYSAKFDPKIKSLSQQMGFSVFAYTLDGGGDKSFPYPMVPRRINDKEPLADEILTFFGTGMPIATPTSFVVNVNTNKAYPLYQGDTDDTEIMSRMNGIILADEGHIDAAQLGPVPTGSSTSAQ